MKLSSYICWCIFQIENVLFHIDKNMTGLEWDDIWCVNNQVKGQLQSTYEIVRLIINPEKIPSSKFLGRVKVIY